jgi:hypothetical protein
LLVAVAEVAWDLMNSSLSTEKHTSQEKGMPHGHTSFIQETSRKRVFLQWCSLGFFVKKECAPSSRHTLAAVEI